MRGIFIFAPLLLAACAGGAQTGDRETRLTDKQSQELAKALAGKVPGRKTNCIPTYARNDLTVISNDILLYRSGNNLVYRNDVIGTCSGLTSGGTLITQSFGGDLCRGDIAHVADLRTGMLMGSCALGDFVPYRKP